MFIFVFQLFIQSDLMFSSRPYFLTTFCTEGVREGVVVAFFSEVSAWVKGEEHCAKQSSSALLVLTRVFLDLHKSIVHHFVSH